MNIAARLVELPQRLAWKRGQALNPLYRRAFREWGAGTVMVSPLKVQGPERISVGSGVAFFPGVWLATETTGSVKIGDHVYVGHGTHVHGVGSVRIGSHTLLGDHVFVGSGSHDMARDMATVDGGDIVIGDRVFVGESALVLGGVTIGDWAVVGAGAVVTKDVPAGTVVVGVPARPVGRNPAAPADLTSNEEAA